MLEMTDIVGRIRQLKRHWYGVSHQQLLWNKSALALVPRQDRYQLAGNSHLVLSSLLSTSLDKLQSLLIRSPCLLYDDPLAVMISTSKKLVECCTGLKVLRYELYEIQLSAILPIAQLKLLRELDLCPINIGYRDTGIDFAAIRRVIQGLQHLKILKLPFPSDFPEYRREMVKTFHDTTVYNQELSEFILYYWQPRKSFALDLTCVQHLASLQDLTSIRCLFQSQLNTMNAFCNIRTLHTCHTDFGNRDCK
jgi:hypothetical protein